MNNKFLALAIISILISFACGFMLANALNRSEMAKLEALNTKVQKEEKSPAGGADGLNLSKEEIKAKIDEADNNSKDFAFQKGLGLALYRYAAVKQETELFTDVIRLLERANQLNPDDYLVIVSLGNIYYDVGQINKDSKSNLKARELYKKALEKNPKDTNVLTDYGLTFLLNDIPDKKRAIKEFETALSENPKNEKALVYMTQAQAEEKNTDEAKKYLTRLKEVNPNNERITSLEALISGENK
jgi:tetratricopeptide (TPR) repeat protein